MTFASVKELQASRKFELIRMTPARDMTNALTSLGGGLYSFTTDFFLSAIEENSAPLGKVSGTPGTGEFSYDESSGTCVLNPNNTPSLTNPIVMFHHIFLTGEVYRTWYEDPENSATPLRDWQPLIKNSPNVGQSIENLLAGVLTITNSNIEVINNNYDMNKYLTADDSFYNKEVKIWLCLDSEANMQKIFEGRVGSLSLDRETVSFDVRDNLSLLDNPALMGDSVSEAYFRLDDYPSLYSASNGSPRFYIVGSCSRYQTLVESVSGLTTAQKLDIETLYVATNTVFDSNLSNTVNRSWGICRTSSEGFQDISFTALSVDNSNPNFTKFAINLADKEKAYIGDTYIIVQGPTFYTRVLYVDRSNGFVYCTSVGVTGTPTLQSNNCPSILIRHEDIVHYCMYGRDYTATVATTSGGNKTLDITFSTSLEATMGWATPLDPSSDEVYFRVRPAKIYHGDLLKKITESVGLIVNAASITAINAALPVYSALSIPKFDEVDYDSSLFYVEHVLESVFGYIYLDNNFELVYELFTDPSSTETITDTDIAKGSYSVRIDYQDIISQLIAYNPHANSNEFVAKTGTSLESKTAKCLHGFSRSTRFQHCLEDITGRLSQILKYRSNRSAKYLMKTITKNLDSHLGEDFNLVKSGLLGVSSKQAKIISINKGVNSSSLTLTDLGV